MKAMSSQGFVLSITAVLATRAVGQETGKAFYVGPAEVDLVKILGPPPTMDSPEGKADLQAVLAAVHRFVGMTGFDADHRQPRGSECMPEVRAESAGFHTDKLRVRGMVANCLGDCLGRGGTFSFPLPRPFAIHYAQVGH